MMIMRSSEEHSDKHPEYDCRNETDMRTDEKEAADKRAAPKEFE
jgi:hypothetical protein